jgi:hypothetical protein
MSTVLRTDPLGAASDSHHSKPSEWVFSNRQTIKSKKIQILI